MNNDTFRYTAVEWHTIFPIVEGVIDATELIAKSATEFTIFQIPIFAALIDVVFVAAHGLRRKSG